MHHLSTLDSKICDRVFPLAITAGDETVVRTAHDHEEPTHPWWHDPAAVKIFLSHPSTGMRAGTGQRACSLGAPQYLLDRPHVSAQLTKIRDYRA